MFIGVPVGEDVVRNAAALSASLRRRFADERIRARWVSPQNMHLTLRFLGPVAPGQVPTLKEALDPLAARHAGFLATFGGLGAFPRPDHPSVLWAGVAAGAEAFANLAADISQTADALGFPQEDRPFHPHLTLARFRREDPADLGPLIEEHAGVELGPCRVRDIVLFQSNQRPRGPVYVPVHRAGLHSGGRLSVRPEPPAPDGGRNVT